MEKLIGEFSVGLFFWQTLLFILLLLLLRRYAWKPILNAVNEREEGIKNALASAEEAKKEMQNISADNEKLLKEARATRERMMKEARELKEKMLADAKDQASEEAGKIIKQAQATIESEKQAAIADLKKQMATLSVDIAEKVVRKELSAKDQQLALVEEMLDEVTLN